MTQDEIIEMARQAGFTEIEFYGNKVGTNVTKCLEVFAKLVAAKERERIKEENQRCYVDRGEA